MNLTDIANFSVAVGTLLSGFSIMSGYFLYRRSKEDEFASTTRKILINTRETCYNINKMVTYDLAHEVSESVIFSPSVTYELDKLKRDIEKNNITDDDIPQYIKDNFPPITAPVTSALIIKIEAQIGEASTNLAILRITYPGLYRVASSIVSIMSLIVNNQKKILRVDEYWQDLLSDIMVSMKDYSIVEIQHFLRSIFIATCNMQVKKHDQEDIDDFLKALDLTVDSYLGKNNYELSRISKAEQKIIFKPISETKMFSEDLREAEKALEKILSINMIKEYRELIVKYEQRHKQKSDE